MLLWPWKIQHTGMETRWKCVSFDEILPETRQMQSDILLAKQFLKASLSPPQQPTWQGRWQAGDRACQAPVSWLLGRGASQASWLLDLLASLQPWKCSGDSSLLCEVSGNSYFNPTLETQISIFICFPSLLESNLIEACFLGWDFYFLGPFIFEYRISQGMEEQF